MARVSEQHSLAALNTMCESLTNIMCGISIAAKMSVKDKIPFYKLTRIPMNVPIQIAKPANCIGSIKCDQGTI